MIKILGMSLQIWRYKETTREERAVRREAEADARLTAMGAAVLPKPIARARRRARAPLQRPGPC